MPKDKTLVATGGTETMTDERRTELSRYFPAVKSSCGCTFLGSERSETCGVHAGDHQGNLRDEFAKAALSSLILRVKANTVAEDVGAADVQRMLSERAYLFADAMLAARTVGKVRPSAKSVKHARKRRK